VRAEHRAQRTELHPALQKLLAPGHDLHALAVRQGCPEHRRVALGCHRRDRWTSERTRPESVIVDPLAGVVFSSIWAYQRKHVSAVLDERARHATADMKRATGNGHWTQKLMGNAEGTCDKAPGSDAEPALRQPIGVGHCRRSAYLTRLMRDTCFGGDHCTANASGTVAVAGETTPSANTSPGGESVSQFSAANA
jgi:hypothetical protein